MNALISSPDGGGSLTAGGVLFGYAEVRIPPPQPGTLSPRFEHKGGVGVCTKRQAFCIASIREPSL